MKRSLLAGIIVLAAACGGGVDKKGTNGTPNNGPPNNTASNNGTSNNGTSNNGTNNTGGTNNTVGMNNPNATNNQNNTTPTAYTCFEDGDGDGYAGTEVASMIPCVDAGLAAEPEDCDDANVDIQPDAAERCDGVDRNCDDAWTASVPGVCSTIQQALDAAASSGATGVVDIAAGTYAENLEFGGAAVHLRGAGAGSTTIDGSGDDAPVVTFADGEDRRSVLEGFTITGGSGRSGPDGVEGGGIYVEDADPILRDLFVTDNRASGDSGYGGGIHLAGSRSLLENVRVHYNSSGYYGGGIHLLQSDVTMRQVELLGNLSIYGGGLACYFSDASIDAIILSDNSASYGGALFIQGGEPTIRNATIVANDANEGAAMELSSNATPVLTNFLLAGNSSDDSPTIVATNGAPDAAYWNVWDSGVDPWAGIGPADIPGLLELEPGFVSLDGNGDDWDLHLTTNSPLRDQGSPDITDTDGSRSDLGAYGGPYGDW